MKDRHFRSGGGAARGSKGGIGRRRAASPAQASKKGS